MRMPNALRVQNQTAKAGGFVVHKYFDSKLASAAISGSFLLIAAMVGGCAGANVIQGTTAAPVSVSRPNQIVVYDFAVSGAEVTQNQGPLQRLYRAATQDTEQQQAGQLQTGHDTAKELSNDLVKRLTDLGFNAQQMARGTPAPDGALVMDGQFVAINQGNTARRLIIGFGAGAATLDTRVNIYQVANGAAASLLDFTTHADSGKMPGAAVTMGAGAAAQGGATLGMGAANLGLAGGKTYTSTMGYLADSTAKQVVAYFSQYAADQGWISQDQAQKVKLDNAQ